MAWLQLIQLGAIWGTVLGLVFSVAVLGMGKLDVAMLLREYPPDVQAKFGPMPEVSRKRSKQLQIPLLLALALVVMGGLWHLRTVAGKFHFSETLLVTTVLFQVWNLLDLLWLDYFILLTLRPKFMILPGTEGLAGYRDYAFHARKFWKGVALTFFLALVVTGITVLGERFF